VSNQSSHRLCNLVAHYWDSHQATLSRDSSECLTNEARLPSLDLQSVPSPKPRPASSGLSWCTAPASCHWTFGMGSDIPMSLPVPHYPGTHAVESRSNQRDGA
jgi:hypothetical protein